jgi:hypothetical protein
MRIHSQRVQGSTESSTSAVRKSKKYGTESHGQSSDRILDTIDERIGTLLSRSSEIESKLDSLEQKSPQTKSSGPVRQNLKPVFAQDIDLGTLVHQIQFLAASIEEIRDQQVKTSMQIREIHNHILRSHRPIDSDSDLDE